MALLKVIFPHHDENGLRHEAGDYREVPDHMVDRFLMPYPGIGFKVMAADSVTEASLAGYTPEREPSLEEELAELEAAPKSQPAKPEADEEIQAEDEAEAEAEEPAKGKKRNK